jgi:hypothetical protein
LNFFLDTLWQTTSDAGKQKGAAELDKFLQTVVSSEVALESSNGLLKSLRAVEEEGLQEAKSSSKLLKQIVEAGKTNTSFTSISYGTSTGKTDPLALIEVRKFIELVKAVERSYPNDTSRDIVTRLRHLYYPGDNPVMAVKILALLPNANNLVTKTVRSFDGTSNTVSKPRSVYKYDVGEETYRHLTAKADENRLGDNPSPYVVLPSNGEVIDVGHLLLTLDALLHPGSLHPYSTYGVPTIDPASWVADVGIGAVWLQRQLNGNRDPDAPKNLKLSSTPTTEEIDEFYKASAPEPDILGDVDGFGIYAMFERGGSFSEQLEKYYLGWQGESPGFLFRWFLFSSLNELNGVVEPSLRLPNRTDSIRLLVVCGVS